VAEHFGDRSQPEPVDMRDLLQRVRSNEVIVLDARPVSEYEAGHIDGAISVPVDELQSRLRTLPSDKEYVAYCRGPYCVYADRAVELLLKSRRRARRLAAGFREWRAAGFPVARGAAPVRRGRQLHVDRTPTRCDRQHERSSSKTTKSVQTSLNRN
jgi:rhodanese-related sulfurtransferase